MKTKLIMVAAALAAMASVQAAEHTPPHWEYQGKAGTAHWGDLEPGFSACKLGKAQSPIDIHAVRHGAPAPIDFAYAPSHAEIVNNGHTVQVNLPEGGAVHLASGDYQVVQFHFHTPSEETVNGKHYPLVAHMVHRNAAGELAVVAVLFKEGKENPALKPLFAGLPAHAGDKHAVEGDFNLAALLPARHDYYAYMGSLTTPPCSEGVHWQILKQPVDISKRQLAAFRKLYPMNARPVQPLNGRVVEVTG
ncbi:carbonic anhydrase [Pseudoduganella chitinolytica]|uniref:carbonic anhydrase n=1 Tax=Pseudoduganella chitinolytica TaxID=34070 RepID=A0ABY8BAA7_9BURK|nr:carbonic anhydrase family protein [Pseudoduganella chitinolytica]WEF31926.1 carbonic anhydrase family protein [Pseudoduganella chitinolytica]